MMMKKVLVTTLLATMIALPVSATPSSLIWVPSTDLQPQGQTHLGIDNYFNHDGNAYPVDIGLTWGFKNGEVGIDYLPGSDPVTFNFKFGLVNQEKFKVVAGVQGWGSGANNQQLKYVLASQSTKDGTRFTLGYGDGKKEVIGNDNKMLIAGIDKQLNDKWWAGVDYMSGDSSLGALNFGVSYTFAPNTSVLFGYDIYNNSTLHNTFTTQLDINF